MSKMWEAASESQKTIENANETMATADRRALARRGLLKLRIATGDRDRVRKARWERSRYPGCMVSGIGVFGSDDLVLQTNESVRTRDETTRQPRPPKEGLVLLYRAPQLRQRALGARGTTAGGLELSRKPVLTTAK